MVLQPPYPIHTGALAALQSPALRADELRRENDRVIITALAEELADAGEVWDATMRSLARGFLEQRI